MENLRNVYMIFQINTWCDSTSVGVTAGDSSSFSNIIYQIREALPFYVFASSAAYKTFSLTYKHTWPLVF